MPRADNPTVLDLTGYAPLTLRADLAQALTAV